VVASHTPTYGFKYAGTKKHRTFEVDEERMAVVKRIFYMVGVEQVGVRAVVATLNREGVPTPPHPIKTKYPEQGQDRSRAFIRWVIVHDVYKPHMPEEIAELVQQGYMAPEVAARLDPEEHYGIWWYRGKDYDGNQHRVAVPVPDSGIPRDWVDAARKATEDNVPASNAGDRFWQLSGGILLCGGCGCRMQVHPMKSPKRENLLLLQVL
jgi:site-specific DNA recombinase